MRTESTLAALLTFALVAAAAAAAELPPENARVRLRLRHMILGPLNEAQRADTRQFGDDGHPVRFQIVEDGEHTFYLFLNQATGGDFPTVWEGNVSVKRRSSDGRPVYMTMLLRRDPGTYVRLHPDGRRVRLEASLYGVQVHSSVMIAMPFEDAVAVSLERLIELTAGRVDWDLLAGAGRGSPAVAQVLSRIREVLPHLRDEDDGAFDRSGRPVLISTGLPSRGGLNCSGFAKWVMDGFYRPLTGSGMDIEALKAKEPATRGNRWSARYEAERDPFFGLDWTRNMAVALARARTGRSSPAETFDVRSLPFLQYVEDVGYPIEKIELALYLLARAEPDRIYLASINKEFGREPVLRQHTHVAVLLPYFDREGRLRVSVLERNAETDLDSLRAGHPGASVHLVQVPVHGEFAPFDPGSR